MDATTNSARRGVPMGPVDSDRAAGARAWSHEAKMSLRVWERGVDRKQLSPKGRNEKLQPMQGGDARRNVGHQDAGMDRLEGDAGPMLTRLSRREELFRPRHHGVRRVERARRVREVLGARGPQAVAESLAGQNRQLGRLCAGERPVGDVVSAASQPAQQSHVGDRRRGPVLGRVVGAVRSRSANHRCEARRHGLGCEAGRVSAATSQEKPLAAAELVF